MNDLLTPPAADDDLPIFPEQHDEPEPKTPLTARAVAIASARFFTGIVGIAAGIVVVTGASILPLPSESATAPSAVVTPVPTAQQLVCPGAVLRLATEEGQDATTASALGVPESRYASSTGRVDASALDNSDAGTGGSPAAPIILSTPPDEADPTATLLVSGAQAQIVQESEYIGLAAADCAVPSGEAWLVGGSTAVGRTTLLTLSNPSEVAATVDVELFGESGPVIAPGTKGIVVAPSGQRVLSLAGFSPDIESTVVHVTSSGGQIVAELQPSIIRSLDPGGIDIVSATNAPATDVVIPGLRVTALGAVQQLLSGGPDFEDLRTTLRLFAPGEGTVTTTISVVPEDGTSLGTSFTYDIEAGRVADVLIGDLSEGSYTIRVSSPVPLVAAARVSTAVAATDPVAAPNATDFAWVTGAPALTGTAQFTVAPGPSPLVHLTNGSAAAATITLTELGGDSMEVTLAAGASTSMPVDESRSYALSGADTLFVSLSFAGPGQLAGFTVQPPGAGSTPITVFR